MSKKTSIHLPILHSFTRHMSPERPPGVRFVMGDYDRERDTTSALGNVAFWKGAQTWLRCSSFAVKERSDTGWCPDPQGRHWVEAVRVIG